MSSDPTAGNGRERQRRRTRKAILDAAVALISRGEQPSAGEIAEAADVSRRTVYLYFPTIEHLLADAALEVTRAGVEPRIEEHGDPADRLEALVRALQQGFADTEALGRTILRHTIGQPQTEAEVGTPRRGYRRIGWIEQALEPLRETIPPERFELLVSGLTLLVGWEAMIVLQDTRGLTAAQAEEVSVWAARALLDAAARGQLRGR